MSERCVCEPCADCGYKHFCNVAIDHTLPIRSGDCRSLPAAPLPTEEPPPHHEHCDTRQPGPEAGPSDKPCNCGAERPEEPPRPSEPSAEPMVLVQISRVVDTYLRPATDVEAAAARVAIGLLLHTHRVKAVRAAKEEALMAVARNAQGTAAETRAYLMRALRDIRGEPRDDAAPVPLAPLKWYCPKHEQSLPSAYCPQCASR